MARTYKRDSSGRFAGGGGGGGSGGKSGGGKSAGKRLGGKSKGPKMGSGRPGTSAPGGSVAKGSFNRSMGATRGMGKASKAPAATAASKRPAKMSKAPASKAKASYKQARSRAREALMMAGGRTSTRGLGKRTDAGAKNIRANVKAAQSAAAKVRKMERNRGRSGRRR